MMKSPRLTTIAIIAIILGCIPFVFGLSMINENNPVQTVTIEGTEYSLGAITSVNMVPKFDSKFNSTFTPAENIKLNFDTLVIFEGDHIGITTTATGVNSKVSGIALLFNPDIDITQASNPEIVNEISESKKFGTIIELSPNTNPPFYSRNTIPFLIPNEEVRIQGIALVGNTLHRLANPEFVTIVHPATDKLQADTNRAILKQIEETKIATEAQERTNNIFLGLAWIGVAIVPILAGTDILLRIHFDSKR